MDLLTLNKTVICPFNRHFSPVKTYISFSMELSLCQGLNSQIYFQCQASASKQGNNSKSKSASGYVYHTFRSSLNHQKEWWVKSSWLTLHLTHAHLQTPRPLCIFFLSLLSGLLGGMRDAEGEAILDAAWSLSLSLSIHLSVCAWKPSRQQPKLKDRSIIRKTSSHVEIEISWLSLRK